MPFATDNSNPRIFRHILTRSCKGSSLGRSASGLAVVVVVVVVLVDEEVDVDDAAEVVLGVGELDGQDDSVVDTSAPCVVVDGVEGLGALVVVVVVVVVVEVWLVSVRACTIALLPSITASMTSRSSWPSVPFVERRRRFPNECTPL